MTTTLHPIGTPVAVPPCRMHAAQLGVIQQRCVLRNIGTHSTERIVEYWIRFEDGEECLHPHHNIEALESFVLAESDSRASR